jgi:hypothetical protein
VSTARQKTSVLEDRRRWQRLPILVPVFVRSIDNRGEECIDFANAVNIGGGGALVITRRYYSVGTHISIEIPSAPLSLTLPLLNTDKIFNGTVIRANFLNQYHVWALKFAQPLVSPAIKIRRDLPDSVSLVPGKKAIALGPPDSPWRH